MKAGSYTAVSVCLVNTCHYVQLHSSEAIVYVWGMRVRACVFVCASPAQSPDAGFNFCSVTQRVGRRGESGCYCQKLALVPQLVCVCLHIRRCTLCVCTLSNVHVAAQKPYMHVHPCVHAQQRCSGGEKKNSSRLHSVYSVAAVETVRQRGEREETWRGVGWGSGMTRCEVITSAYGCRKPYIRCVYVYEITAASIRYTPSCASVAGNHSGWSNPPHQNVWFNAQSLWLIFSSLVLWGQTFTTTVFLINKIKLFIGCELCVACYSHQSEREMLKSGHREYFLCILWVSPFLSSLGVWFRALAEFRLLKFYL